MEETGRGDSNHDTNVMDHVSPGASDHPVPSPAKSLRRVRWSIFVAIAGLAASLVTASVLTLGATIVAFLAACAAASFSSSAHACGKDRRLPEHLRLGKWTHALMLGSAVVLMGLSAMSARWQWSQMRQISSAMMTQGNLRGIGRALDEYRKDHGETADVLDRLVALNIIRPRNLFSMGDVNVPTFDPPGGYYSSFVYDKCPARLSGNSRVVVAYELECWTLIKTGLLAEYGRCVLFADGHVEVLSEDAFAEAMMADAKIRGGQQSAAGDAASESSEAER